MIEKLAAKLVFQEELELLKSKIDRLEKERNEFKHSVDKLETKVLTASKRKKVLNLSRASLARSALDVSACFGAS